MNEHFQEACFLHSFVQHLSFMRYLDPKNDLTFKKIFGQHPNILKHFLNAVLPLPANRQIEKIEYLPAELVPEVPLFKFSIVDVRCTDNLGRQFIVEMQMLWTDSFTSRVIFNASKAYVKQLQKGEDFKALQPVYALSLVNDVFEPNTSDYFHHYQIVNVQKPATKLEGLEFIFVELPKITGIAREQLLPGLGTTWLRFLAEIKNMTTQVSPDFLVVPEIKQALDILQESAFTAAELEYYDKYWDSIMVEATLIKDAKLEGKKEQAFETARILILQGVDRNVVIKATGLSDAELNSIIN